MKSRKIKITIFDDKVDPTKKPSKSLVKRFNKLLKEIKRKTHLAFLAGK